MNKFIDITHTPAQKGKQPSSYIKIKVKPESNFILKDKFPLKIKIRKLFNKEVVFSCELSHPGSFYLHHWFEHKELLIYTSENQEIMKETWSPHTHGSETTVAFDIWSEINKKTKGVIIGSNDGIEGEYVFPFLKECYSKLLFVEGSPVVFERLKENYKKYSNVQFLNEVITPNGGEVIFYEATDAISEGETNSILKEHIENFVGKEYREIKADSMGINELLINNGFSDLDWLHIDVEGIDDQLILALDFNKIKKPKVIIYEKVFVYEKCSLSQKDKALQFLEDNGYFVWVDTSNGYNNMAILN